MRLQRVLTDMLVYRIKDWILRVFAGVVWVLMMHFIVTVEASGAEVDSSGDNSLHFLCCSVHHQGAENEVHLGVFYERQVADQWRVITGTFRNSLDVQSFVLGVQREWILSENWDAMVSFGTATGYPVPLIVMPALEFKDRVRLNIVPGVVYAVQFTVIQW